MQTMCFAGLKKIKCVAGLWKILWEYIFTFEKTMLRVIFVERVRGGLEE